MTLKAKKKYIHQLLVSRSSRPKIHSNKSRSMRYPPPCTDLCFCKDLGNMENQLPKKWKKMSSSPRNSFNHNDKNLSLFILQMYFLITLLYTSRSKQQLKITGRISAIHLTVWHSLILWMLVSTLYWYKNDLMIVSMIWTDHKTECHSILLQVRSLLERNTMVWTSSPDFCSS